MSMHEPEVRHFFAFFNLPRPQPEHRKIADVIREVSSGDFKIAPVAGGIVAVFTAKLRPWQIGFGTVLLNEDSLFITEIRPGSYSHRGFGAAGGWINSHMPHR